MIENNWMVSPWYRRDPETGERIDGTGLFEENKCKTKTKAFRTLFFAKRYAYLQAKKYSECVVIEWMEHPCTYYLTYGNHCGIWCPKRATQFFVPVLNR